MIMEPNTKTKSIIGVDLGGTLIKVGRVSRNILEDKSSCNVDNGKSANALFEDICKTIKKVWKNDVTGIGFAVPALIDFESGVIHGASNIKKLNNYPIKSALENQFQVPVILQNDANCFVLGEKFFGNINKNSDNIVGLVIGTGVGAGLLLGGKIYNGLNFGAGEIGMIPYKNGRFEDYCSGKYFEKFHKTTGRCLYEMAKQNDPYALHILELYGKHLGELINLIIYVLDPDCIVIGGSVSKSFNYFKSGIFDSMKSLFFTDNKKVSILATENPHIAILGAASLFAE